MKPLSVQEDAQLSEALKRCSPETREAAQAFRRTGDFAYLPTIVRGVIARYVESERRTLLADANANPELRLIDDLGIDSLTMMEIVMLAEEALPITISNEELRHLRTLGEIEQFVTSKLRGEVPPRASGSDSWYLDDIRQHQGSTDDPPTSPSHRPAA